MFALVALLYLHCAKTRSIEHRFLEVESVSGIVCPEEHTMFDALAPSVVVCATRCSTAEDGCRSVNVNLTSHVCLGCKTSDLSSTASSEAQSGMVFLKNSQSVEVNATMVGTIDVRTADDGNTCWISGSALLPGDKLVLVDCHNNKVKLVNLQTSEVTSQLRVAGSSWDDSPWGVAIIKEDQVAVTQTRKIIFVTVTSVLKVDREISVEERCTGIVYNNERFIVAFTDPAKIQIMAIDGNVEKNIDCSKIFKSPFFIALNSEHDAIYVSDFFGGRVKRLGLDGEVEAEYEDEHLRFPNGVIVDQQGRVIVCGKGPGSIHLLTADLANIKLLVDGLKSPQSLSLCHSTGRLYVGYYDNVNVSVYHLS